MRKKAHIAIREGEKIRNVYVRPEEKEEIKKIKKEQGLRSLREAYEVWKQAKEILQSETSDYGESKPPPEFNPDDPDADLKRDELILDLKEQIKDLQIEKAIMQATLESVQKQNDDLRRYGTRRRRPKRKNDTDQRTVSDSWPQVKEEMERD